MTTKRKRSTTKVVTFLALAISFWVLLASLAVAFWKYSDPAFLLDHAFLPPARPCAAYGYMDANALEEALIANRRFHRGGGSLKSIEQFRDQAVDGTLEKLEIDFVTDGGQNVTSKLMGTLKSHYEKHTDRRGGYGKPLPGKLHRRSDGRTDKIPAVMTDRWIEPIEDWLGRGRWDAALGPIGPACHNLTQIGDSSRDGFKFMCLPKTPSNAPCHIISVGGNDNWKFEEAVTEMLGCTTHTFDCTLPKGPRHKPARDDVRFYPFCMDGTSRTDARGRSYLTYADMLKTANLTEAPLYFKMDVEGFEYDIFTQMLDDAKFLPRQIEVELHWVTRMTGLSWMPRTRSAAEIALFSSMMYEAEYLPVHTDFNEFCPGCMEVLYFRTTCQ